MKPVGGFGIHVGTGIEESVNHRGQHQSGGDMNSLPAIDINKVKGRPAINEIECGIGPAESNCLHQSRPVLVGFGVDIRPQFEQELNHFETPVFSGPEERRHLLIVACVNISPGIQ